MRRSSRLQRVAPEHDGSAIDAFDEAVDGDSSRTTKTHRNNKDVISSEERIATGPAGGGIWASEDVALEASRQWLEDARALMGMRTAASTGPSNKRRPNDDNHDEHEHSWRREAVKRWGSGVPAASDVADWEGWVRSRVGTPPPPSDMQLLQEYYAHDTWQLLVACILMSRVSSWQGHLHRDLTCCM